MPFKVGDKIQNPGVVTDKENNGTVKRTFFSYIKERKYCTLQSAEWQQGTHVYHVNMLKRWFEWDDKEGKQVIAAVCIADHSEEDNK